VDPDPDWIRIQRSLRIRIPNPDPDPDCHMDHVEKGYLHHQNWTGQSGIKIKCIKKRQKGHSGTELCHSLFCVPSLLLSGSGSGSGIRIQIRIEIFCLDPDPDPEKMNPDPQHCYDQYLDTSIKILKGQS